MKDSKTLSRQAFDHQASGYDLDKNGLHARNQYQTVLAEISNYTFSHLLDVGCGTGELLKYLISKYPSIRFYGVDISEKMLEVAQSKLTESVNLLLGDAENLPFDNDVFDFVICNDSFHHYPNPQKAIFEFHRVLQNKGILLISDYWKPFPVRQVMNFFIKYSSDGDVKIYSQEEMIRFVKSAGFSNVSFRKISKTSYIIEAQK